MFPCLFAFTPIWLHAVWFPGLLLFWSQVFFQSSFQLSCMLPYLLLYNSASLLTYALDILPSCLRTSCVVAKWFLALDATYMKRACLCPYFPGCLCSCHLLACFLAFSVPCMLAHCWVACSLPHLHVFFQFALCFLAGFHAFTWCISWFLGRKFLSVCCFLFCIITNFLLCFLFCSLIALLKASLQIAYLLSCFLSTHVLAICLLAFFSACVLANQLFSHSFS